jgi:zinc ribbon protein
MSEVVPDKPGKTSSDPGAPAARAMIKCPKCSTEVREVARFCTRCHATLRFQCPSCAHEQRHGGTCEKCGIDFLKYIGATAAAKKIEADRSHDYLERRSTLLKNILYIPFTLGIPLIRMFLTPRDRDK